MTSAIEDLSEDPSQGASSGRRRRRSSHSRHSARVVWLLVAAAAVGGGLAGCHPTGTAGIDEIYGAAVAAVVTLAASRATRSTLLLMTGVGFALSRSWLFIPAGVALALAFAAVFRRRAYRRYNALVAAIGVQVILRWPHTGFHGLTAILAAAAVAPVLYSGWRHSASKVRRLSVRIGLGLLGLGVLLTIPVVISAFAARHPVDRGISLAKSSLSEVESGQAPAATARLSGAATDLESAHSDVGGWWNLGGYLVPVVAQQERALDRGTRAGADLTATGAREAGHLDLQSIRYQGGRVDLTALEALQGPAQTLDSAVASAQSQVAHSQSQWLISPITDKLTSLGAVLAKARNSTDLAVLGLKTAPSLLGADGTRHYFVVFMTPAETRGLGGFIGAYGELTVDNGQISLTRSGRTTELDATLISNPALVAPASYVNRYGAFAPQRYFQDLTYAPDLPTVEQVIAGIYPQVGGDQIDGVLVVDPYSLAALLKFTGPITLPGFDQPLTSANAADILIRQQYIMPDQTTRQRYELQSEALNVGFQKLTGGSLPSPKTLAEVLDPEVRQGRLLFWSSHPSDRALLNRIGISGAFPNPQGGDLLAVTTANAGNSKIDAYVHQQTIDDVTYDPTTGHVKANVTISLQNNAPSSGLPPDVIGSYDGSGLPSGTSAMWLSLYTPLRVETASLDGQPFQFSSPIGEDGVEASSGYVNVAPMSTAHLSVTLEGYLRPGPDYAMTVRLQPLANPQDFQVRVTPVDGWTSTPADDQVWSATADLVQRHTWAYHYP